MGKFYSCFIDQHIKIRENILEDRKEIMTWSINPNLPIFISEKIEEIRLLVVLGLDNSVMKSIVLLIEEILIHLLISEQINYKEQYIPLLIENDSKFKYGHQVLAELKRKDLIDEEDYKLCARYCNSEKHGGERIRNIEIHNLIADKIAKFNIRPELSHKMDQETTEILKDIIKNDPNFIYLGAKDMTIRNILQELNNLFVLANKNAARLSKFNNLQDKDSYEIEESLPRSRFFLIEVEQPIAEEYLIEQDIRKLGDVLDVIELKIMDSEKNKVLYQYKFQTQDEHSGFDMLVAFDSVKSNPYPINSIGIDVEKSNRILNEELA